MAGMGLMYAHAQAKPAWVDGPSAVYPDRLYVSAVGSGRDRRGAETGALAALTAYFRQSVTSVITINDTERQVNGRSNTESLMSQSIEAAAALDTLMGAEIKNAWNDTRNKNWYAVAVMEKAKCGGLYAGELDKTITEIKALADVTGGVSFETITRCRKAQDILEKAGVYAQILAMLDGPDRQAELSRLGTAVTAALAEAKAIPVDVRVTGDTNGRIRTAFAGAFIAEGFKTGNRNSRFALEVSVSFVPAPRTAYYNTRYTVEAVLKDTRTGTELFSYSAADRESHPGTQGEADNRALAGAERKITEEFPAVVREYLNSH
jgi:hypothetical protein